MIRPEVSVWRLVLKVIPEQLRQNEPLSPRLRHKLETHDCAPLIFRACPGHPDWQHQGLPEGRGVQRKTGLHTLGKEGVTAYLHTPHAQVHNNAGDRFAGFQAQHLGDQGHAASLMGTKVVKSRHADKLPHLARYKAALPW
jgi:hypothetical protein